MLLTQIVDCLLHNPVLLVVGLLLLIFLYRATHTLRTPGPPGPSGPGKPGQDQPSSSTSTSGGNDRRTDRSYWHDADDSRFNPWR